MARGERGGKDPRQARAAARAWAAIGIFLAGCGLGGSKGGDSVEVPRPLLQDGLFPVAAARVTKASVPPVFTAELAATVAAFRAESASLPTAFLEHRLCAGDPEVVGRLGRAVTNASVTASPDELREVYGSLLEYCGREEQCAWTRDAVLAGGALAEVAWVGLAQCGSERNDPLFESDRAPTRQMIGYWSEREWRGKFVHRHIPAMVPALRRAAALGDLYLVRRAAIFLGRNEPTGTAALIAMHGELPVGRLRDEVAAGLTKSSDSAARAILDELCHRPGRLDPICRGDQELVQVIGLPDASAAPPSPSASTQEMGELTARLRQAGLLWRGPLAEAEVAEGEASPPATAEQLLVAAGPVRCFDVETGTYPNEHDKLLFELAELAGRPLSAALFVENPPPLELEDGRFMVGGREVDRLPEGVVLGAPYRLDAYLEGRSYSVDAQDLGDWYDLDQVLGLLNAIAVDRRAEIRVVTLPTGDQTACVLAAPRAAILAGVAAGLLKVGDADAARAAGRAFEGAILEKLESGEIDLDADD